MYLANLCSLFFYIRFVKSYKKFGRPRSRYSDGFFLTLGLQALVLCLFTKYNNFKNSGSVVGVHMSFYVFMDLIKIFPGVKSF